MLSRVLFILGGMTVLSGCASERLTSKDLQPLAKFSPPEELPRSQAVSMDPQDIAQFLEHQSKGAELILKLRDGTVLQGAFSSYEEYYQTVWIVPPSAPRFSRGKSIRLPLIANIQNKENATVTSDSVFGTSGASF